MLRNRMPGPYEDRLGPIVLTVLLVLSILVNMSLKLVDIWAPSSSKQPRPITPAPITSHGRGGRGPIVQPSGPVRSSGGKHGKPVPINDP